MSKSQFRSASIYLSAIIVFATWSLTASADEYGKRSFDYFFANHIDSHQKTKLKTENGKPMRLKGFLYIFFTGEIDPLSGLPIARHPRGAQLGEECGVDDIDCVAGWLINAVPAEAKFLYHSGVNGNDHPIWMVNRIDIPQPGSFTHFHWITSTSTDSRAPTVPDACDKIDAGDLENLAPSAVNVTCPGWFLQIRAVEKFAFEHGGEIIPVYPGIDNATHLNLVTNYAEVQEITPTR